MNESRKYLIVLKNLSGFNYKAAIVNMYKSRPMYYRLVLRVERLLTAEALRRKFISLIITLNKLLEV